MAQNVKRSYTWYNIAALVTLITTLSLGGWSGLDISPDIAAGKIEKWVVLVALDAIYAIIFLLAWWCLSARWRQALFGKANIIFTVWAVLAMFFSYSWRSSVGYATAYIFVLICMILGARNKKYDAEKDMERHKAA